MRHTDRIGPFASLLVAAFVLASWLAAGTLFAQGGPPQAKASAHPALLRGYEITPLGTDAVAIDATGRIAVGAGALAQLFTPTAPNGTSGALAPLGTFGGTVCVGKAINSLGHVTGYSTLADGHYQAFLSGPDGLTPLGPLGGDFESATAINDVGQVAGFGYDSEGNERAFVWTPDVVNGTTGTMVELGTLGGEYSSARGVNGLGVVVGFAYTPQGAFHAFAALGGAMADLGTLGGPFSKAEAINDAGLVVGQAYLANGDVHPCLWHAGGIVDLGSLGGHEGEALAIDSTGASIVGTATVPGGVFLTYHAFLFRDGRMTDLNDVLPAGSGWILERASGINDAGQIVGQGTFHGQTRGFLLTPHF